MLNWGMETQPPSLEALKWQIDAGADEAIGDVPVDRFAEPPAEPLAVLEPENRQNEENNAKIAQKQAKIAPNGTKLEKKSNNSASKPTQTHKTATKPEITPDIGAYKLAAGAKILDDIAEILKTYEGCALKQTATNLVYCDGNKDADILFIGEAPGAEEDRQGRPFVGPAGKMLDRMLGAIGLDREQVLICNTLFWRPPGNRPPNQLEVAACLPFVERTIEIVDPKIVVMVGGTAAKTLLAQNEGIMKLRGKWFEYETSAMVRPIPAMAIYHPAFLLRSPGQKRDAWRDLLEIRKRLDSVH